MIDFTMGSFLLALCSVVTGLIVEAIKKMIEVKRPNIVTAIVSVIVGVIIPCGYMLDKGIAFDIHSIIYIIAIVFLSWMCAMLGYDKVSQTLTQVRR